MAYESKVIFNAVADVLETSKTLDEAYSRVARLANAEGVVLPKTRTPQNKENQTPKEE
jgi:hypothetical protein